jgi:hypothetical protein
MLRMARRISRRWMRRVSSWRVPRPNTSLRPPGVTRDRADTPRVSAHARMMAMLRSVGVPVTGMP